MTDLGWTHETVRSEADKFRDHWHGKAGRDATKADWQATWRNWCRNARTPQQAASGETAYQRNQRERVAALSGGLASAKRPGTRDTIDMEIFNASPKLD